MFLNQYALGCNQSIFEFWVVISFWMASRVFFGHSGFLSLLFSAVLEAADRAGMHASLDLFRIVSGYSFQGSHCTPEAKTDTLRLAVEAAAHNQGLLFYYLMDEPSEKTFPLPTVQAAAKTIRTIDQDHPVAGCFRPGGLQENPEYAQVVDIVMTDPVGHHRYICGF